VDITLQSPINFLISCDESFFRARRSHKEKQTTPTVEVSRRIDSGVTYEEPPHYEFQTVSLDFGHDVHDGREIQSEMPAFTETNKVRSNNLCNLRHF